MVDINWNNFKAKFPDRESIVFERLAYMLFCYEFKISIGIFRFKNQTGIETESIEVDNLKVGFQAKFYDTKLSANKDDIIDSLKKAKSKNPSLNKILIYTNQELSESTKIDKKKPTYLVEIEENAKDLNIDIEWRVPSHFEKQLSIPENDYLAQYFFVLGNGIVEFLNKLKTHSENILFAIQTDIQFKKQKIKIDRTDILSTLINSKAQISILAGEGGSGKTALIKELVSNHSNPYYVLKAAEFAKPSLTAIFNQFGAYDINDFLHFHRDELNKTFVIDSAEKLADLESQDVLIELLSALIKDKWQIVFTTRNSYLDDLCFQMLEVYRLPFDIIKLINLTTTELESLSQAFQFKLPDNSRLQSLISNLFYLNEYLLNYDLVNNQTDIVKFRDILWQKRIQNSKFQKDNAHHERANCFLNLVKTRCDTGSFFVNGDLCSKYILSLLEKDEIIKFEQSQEGYFITHDIYEEWALEKLIEREYATLISHSSFFKNIGNSLPIRRAFRNWIADKIFQPNSGTKQFIEKSFSDNTIPIFWKDELLISVLLSDYSTAFFNLFDNILLANDKFFLRKIIFLLRTACKELDTRLNQIFQNTNNLSNNPAHVFTKPKGNGWETTVEYIHSKISSIQKEDLKFILPLLKDWVRHKPKGSSAKLAGLFALHYYKDAELNKKAHYSSDTESKLLQIVLATSVELNTELVAITEELLSKPFNRRESFDSLREAVIASGHDSIAFIMSLPEYVIKLVDSSWHKGETENHPFYYSGIGVEDYYSIRSHTHHDYFPPSALQTPVYFLLFADFSTTLDFILNFTNRAVHAYFASGFDSSVKEIEVSIGSIKTTQIISSGIWNLYRGSGSPVTPYLLQSMHMALEKRLLEIAKVTDKQKLKESLIHLLKNTRSASLTAVVTSIVLAYPNELFEIATILLGNYEFYKYDNLRAISESQAKRLYLIGGGLNGTEEYKNERLATCEDAHRKLSLEVLALNYQWFKDADTSNEDADKRKEKVWEIIDFLHTTIDSKDSENEKNKSIRLLLARIDRRNMNPVVHQTDDKLLIEFNPLLEPDLKMYSEEGMKIFEDKFKYNALKLWAINKVENHEQHGTFSQYDESTDLVLKETKEILEVFQQAGNDEFYLFNSSTPAYTCSALLKLYSDKLSSDDQIFCKNIVIEYATYPFRKNYDYQIGDGVEVAINTLPFMYKLFPDNKQDFNIILLFILFDCFPLGEYKRICDYGIETISRNLFELSTNDANSILVGFMMFKPKFDEDNPPRRQIGERKTRAEMLEEFATKYEKELNSIGLTEANYSKIDFATQDIKVSETAFQIMPSNTNNPNHLDYIKKLLENFSSEMVKETSYSRNGSEIDYRLKHRFFRKYANFLLHREISSIQNWVKPFVDAFTITSEMADFFSEVICEEDSLHKYDAFWSIWECFYPVIKSAIENSSERDLDGIIRNYLLAWSYWGTAKEWRSLRERETLFFQRVCSDMGGHPSVLYSISRLLNEIGSSFLDNGVIWIAGILSKNLDLYREDSNQNTIYYLEIVARKYVYLNRTKLKTNRFMKDSVLILLDFLVSKGSVNGYLLREDIY